MIGLFDAKSLTLYHTQMPNTVMLLYNKTSNECVLKTSYKEGMKKQQMETFSVQCSKVNEL